MVIFLLPALFTRSVKSKMLPSTVVQLHFKPHWGLGLAGEWDGESTVFM